MIVRSFTLAVALLAALCCSACKKSATAPAVSQPDAAVPAATTQTQTTGQTAGSASWISPDLGLAPATSIAAALQKPFDAAYDVTLRDPKGTSASVRSCADYLKVERNLYSAGNALDAQGLADDGARCDALHILQSAKTVAHPTLTDFTFEKVTAAQLPPDMALVIAPEEDAQVKKAVQNNGSILDLEPTAAFHAKGQREAEISTKDWTATLKVYAIGDLLGDGREELLVRRDAAVRHGSYTSVDLFLLTLSPSTGKLQTIKQP